MPIFVMTWPGRAEVAVYDGATAAHAEDRLMDGQVGSLATHGPPRVREVEPGELLTFHPVHDCQDPYSRPATLKMESHRGPGAKTPAPRFTGTREAWFDFQDRAVALLERYPVLCDLVPPVVRAAWEDGTASIFDLLVEVGERVESRLVGSAATPAKATRTR